MLPGRPVRDCRAVAADMMLRWPPQHAITATAGISAQSPACYPGRSGMEIPFRQASRKLFTSLKGCTRCADCPSAFQVQMSCHLTNGRCQPVRVKALSAEFVTLKQPERSGITGHFPSEKGDSVTLRGKPCRLRRTGHAFMRYAVTGSCSLPAPCKRLCAATLASISRVAPGRGTSVNSCHGSHQTAVVSSINGAAY